MPKTSIKSLLFPNKNKIKIKPAMSSTKSNLFPNLQSLNHKLLSRSGFLEN